MPESGTSGSVRGARSNARPYLDKEPSETGSSVTFGKETEFFGAPLTFGLRAPLIFPTSVPAACCTLLSTFHRSGCAKRMYN